MTIIGSLLIAHLIAMEASMRVGQLRVNSDEFAQVLDFVKYGVRLQAAPGLGYASFNPFVVGSTPAHPTSYKRCQITKACYLIAASRESAFPHVCGLGLTGVMTRFNVRSIIATGIAKTRRIAGSIQLTTLLSGKLSDLVGKTASGSTCDTKNSPPQRAARPAGHYTRIEFPAFKTIRGLANALLSCH